MNTPPPATPRDRRSTAPKTLARRLRLGAAWGAVLVMLALVGCGDDASPEASSNNNATSGTNSNTSATTNSGTIAGDDAGVDAAPDALPNVADAPDAPTDAEHDAAEDVEPDTAEPDAVSDAEPDAESDAEPDADPPVVPNPDLNGDGALNILVLGTSRSIASGSEPFASDAIAAELSAILTGDPSVELDVNVVAEDIYQTAQVTLGLGQGGTEYTWTHSSHSLTQYYHWPEGLDARMARLSGQGGTVWDHVVIGADPHIVATTPGYYALGANTVAAKVAEGGAQPLLLMTWPREVTAIDHFAEHTQRTSHGARVSLPTIPAGRAWAALSDDQRDTSNAHPTPNGAYLAAAAVYAHLYDRSAATSDYAYDDALADAARAAQLNEADAPRPAGPRAFVSPFAAANIPDRVLNYNHTGTSSERGILAGLRWVLERARVELRDGGDAPIDFNFGRANTNFEADKRYQIDPARFDVSFGFPMQDHGGLGDTSMLYGLDKRINDAENGTDLGAALHMVRQGELPSARAVPIRTLYARLKEITPAQSAYRDAWHMHRDLDKASAAFMYTLLTGHCALDDEPDDPDTDAWRQWMAHKVGYETAWTVMHLSGVAPGFKVLPSATNSVQITPNTDTTLTIAFVNPPAHPVTVTLSTDNDAVAYAPGPLVFTPEDHDTPQTIAFTATEGDPGEEVVVITATTASEDPHFDGLTDRWEYRVVR